MRIKAGRKGWYILYQHSTEFLLYANDLHISLGRRLQVSIMWNPTSTVDECRREKNRLSISVTRWTVKGYSYRLKDHKLYKLL